MEQNLNKRIFESKVIVKEISDYLKADDIARMERLSTFVSSVLKNTILDIYINVKLIASDFSTMSKMIDYFEW